jgi:hypothetical protein
MFTCLHCEGTLREYGERLLQNILDTLIHLHLSALSLFKGRDSSVGIATGYGLDGPGIEFRLGRDFPHPSRPALGAHPASCTMGTGSFPGVKRPGPGAGHPPHLEPRLKYE